MFTCSGVAGYYLKFAAERWMLLAEKSLRKLWDNPKDEKVWGEYL